MVPRRCTSSSMKRFITGLGLCLFGAKYLPEPMITYCQLTLWQQNEIWIKMWNFSFKKMHFKMSSSKCRSCSSGHNDSIWYNLDVTEGALRSFSWAQSACLELTLIDIILALSMMNQFQYISPVRRQANIWTIGLLLIGPLETNVGEIWNEVQYFS